MVVADPPLADELAVVVARMSGLLLSRETVESALGDEQGHRTTAAASDDVVSQADDLQYEFEECPCLSAWAECTVFRR